MPICRRSESWVTLRTSWPSMRIAPPSVSKKRRIRLTSVDLPAPERPTSPTFSPGRMVSEIVAQPAGAAAVVVADAVEGDLAAGDGELGAPATSVSWIGWAIVSMPSRITPTFWKSEDSDHMIQPVIAFSRRTSAEAAATVPMLAAPCCQSTSA